MQRKNPSQWYESRRNELLSLLGKATALDLPEKYSDELRQTARKCQEDSFEIALVGEFQGGKSTTFNALCDGRDISPRGLGGGGIKTSAAVISAQNIAGDEKKNGLSEWAEVSFKSPGAIALGLSTILRRPLMDSSEFRKLNDNLSDEKFAEALATDDGFPSIADVSNPKCRKILLDATDSIWAQWESNHASLSDDELDQLRIATLQLRFFGSKGHADMASRTVLPIDKFQQLIAFPKDWMLRWTNGRRAEFDLNEVAFVFVHSVLVRIHSENLRRLGCRITDCPGLFANAYDTNVARRTILNADAVWYLINGEKQIGQKDLEIVRAIASMGMLGKIEATCNLKGPHEQKIAEIIPATKAALSNAGHDIDVFPYNARLAFLAAQGDLLVNRPALFSELDRSCMVADAKIKEGHPSPESMWLKMVRRVGGSAELEEIEDIDELDEKSVAVVRRESLLDVILSRLEKEIIPHKAKSILVDKGSDRASKALVAYEGTLKATEDAAEATEAEWRGKVEKARKTLADFIDRSNVLIDRSELFAGRNELADGMAREIADLSFGDKLADDLSVRIGEAVKKRYKKLYFHKNTLKQDIMADVSPILSDSVKNAMSDALGKWRESKTSKAKNTLRRRASALADDIREAWESASMDVATLANFDIPAIDNDFVENCTQESISDMFSEKDLGSIRMEGVLNAVLTTFMALLCVGLVVAVVAAVVGVAAGAIAVPVAAVGRLAWVAGTSLFRTLTQSDEEKLAEAEAEKKALERANQEKIGKIAATIRPKIAAAFANPDFRKKIEEPLALGFRKALDGVIERVRASLDALKADFEKERVAEPEKMFSQSVKDRKAVAKRNRELRTKTIEPLRKSIDAFKLGVVSELG